MAVLEHLDLEYKGQTDTTYSFCSKNLGKYKHQKPLAQIDVLGPFVDTLWEVRHFEAYQIRLLN